MKCGVNWTERVKKGIWKTSFANDLMRGGSQEYLLTLGLTTDS